MQLSEVGQAFSMLLVIMGPLTGLPVFLRITERFKEARRLRSANRAIRFSACVFLFFLFLGTALLRAFGISIAALEMAGGIVLLLLGITYMFHLDFRRGRDYTTGILVPFAVPLVIGPGVITTTILLTSWYGHLVTLVGGAMALLTYWVVLRYGSSIMARIGQQGIEVVTRIMGLLLMAIGVEMIRKGMAFGFA